MGKWSYSLTPKEEAIAARVGYERQLPMMGQPERNRNYSEGDIWEMWQHSIAAGSELAAARMFGLEDYEPEANTFKTKLDIPGYEIRYSFTRKSDGPRWTLRFNPKVDDPDQIYVLIVGGPEEKTRRNASEGYKAPPYRAVGWMEGHECHDIRYITKGAKPYYQVTVADLHDMDDIPERD